MRYWPLQTHGSCLFLIFMFLWINKYRVSYWNGLVLQVFSKVVSHMISHLPHGANLTKKQKPKLLVCIKTVQRLLYTVKISCLNYCKIWTDSDLKGYWKHSSPLPEHAWVKAKFKTTAKQNRKKCDKKCDKMTGINTDVLFNGYEENINSGHGWLCVEYGWVFPCAVEFDGKGWTSADNETCNMVGILDKDSPYCGKTDSSLSPAVGSAPRVHPNAKPCGPNHGTKVEVEYMEALKVLARILTEM